MKNFAPRRHPTCKREDQTAERVDIIFHIFQRQIDPGSLGKIIQFDTRVGFPDAIAGIDDQILVEIVVLIINIADDLFHEVFNGHKTIGAAIFVDHQRHVAPLRPHLK